MNQLGEYCDLSLSGAGSFCFFFRWVYLSISHIATRCPERTNNINGEKYKSKRDENNKDYKDKEKKVFYIVEEGSNDESDDHDE